MASHDCRQEERILCQSESPHHKHGDDPTTCTLPLGHRGFHEYRNLGGRLFTWGATGRVYPPPKSPSISVKVVDGRAVSLRCTFSDVQREMDAITANRESFGKPAAGEKEDPSETMAASAAAYEEMLRENAPCEYSSYPDATPTPYEHESPLPATSPPKDPAAFESWVQDAAQIFQGRETHFPPTELEVAWDKIEHRMQVIKNQLEVGRNKASNYSYIKSTALLLAMRCVQGALDSLSELIPV